SFATNDYRFRTGSQLRSGLVYRSTNNFMVGTANHVGSHGVWQVSRNNNTLTPSCESGLRVAMVFDLSSSISIANASATLRQAGQEMVTSLEGTGSTLSLYTFGTDAPQGNHSDHRHPLAVDDNAQL